MELTICLITKGREQYLDSILVSLEEALKHEDVSVFIVNNGADSSVTTHLEEWSNARKNVRYRRLPKNDSRPSSYWKIVRESVIGWVTLPSDDDIFVPDIIKVWRKDVASNPNLIAWSPVALVIDEQGFSTGEIRRASRLNNWDQVESLAEGLYEPPFHWPTLFFKIDETPKDVPNSRYAFDWWIGLHLIICGEIGSSSEQGLLYRVHNKQESNLAPSRRKNYETLIIMEEFLLSRRFDDWFSKLNSGDVKRFWKLIIDKGPIYGENEFSIHVIRLVYSLITSSFNDSDLISTVQLDMAKLFGVLLGGGELKNISNRIDDDHLMRFNFSVTLNSSTCSKLIEAFSHFPKEKTIPSIAFRCKHCRTFERSEILFDCDLLKTNKEKVDIDLVIKMITENYENSGILNFSLSPFEKNFVRLVRKIKKVIPYKIVKFINVQIFAKKF
jgi:hypothetical protein